MLRSGIARLTTVVSLCAATATAWGAGFDTSDVSESHRPFAVAGTSNPVAAFEKNGRIRRIYGEAFSQGATPEASAAAFIQNNADRFGAVAADLVPLAMGDGGGNTLGLMWNQESGAFKFTAVYFGQQRDGLSVFRTRLTALVRNEPGFPLVLVNPDVRDLGDFHVAAPDLGAVPPIQVADVAVARFGPNAVIDSSERVIFAGVDDEVVAPRLADVLSVSIDFDKWQLVVDVNTSAILYEEHRVYFTNAVAGDVTGLATQGIGSEQCEPEVSMPLPYLQVDVPSQSQTGYTDENGHFSIPLLIKVTVTVEAGLNGQWFDVADFFNNEETLSQSVTPPAEASLEFNAGNAESERAQVNAYLQANIERDYVLDYNPTYPTLSTPDFQVTVNRTDQFCPGNAWYAPGDPSLNFCQAASGYPNTSWTSVIYHEYGHHLVEAGGSGQGPYGEGMGDVMSVLLLDDPALGLGFFGDCGTSLRHADNTCQYQTSGCSSCGSEAHDCGQLIAGCVWDTRNELVVTEPGTYRDILSNIAINSILIHSGSSINPGITVDYLTLDDDNGTIFDGTPHYTEIDTGFGLHNMPGPALALLAFTFPNGQPSLVSNAGGTTLRVEVSGVSAAPEPGTGLFFVDTGDGGGFQSLAMTEISANVYDATFPATDCGNQVRYYFSAETTTGSTQVWPTDAPTSSYSTVAADTANVILADDFETDTGWTVSGNASSGQWERGIPANGNRGDPPADADGSGQCYLTENFAGNSDVDGGYTTLTSPVMDATGDATYVKYQRWYSNVEGAAPEQDVFVVEVSDNGGASWTNLETVGPAGPEVQGGWFEKSYRVADVVTPNDQFRIRFTAEDAGSGSVVEAAVDGFELVQFECGGAPPCPGDVDGSGDVGFGDILQVIGAWGPCPGCPEDVDGSGDVGFGDILQLIGIWGPCP